MQVSTATTTCINTSRQMIQASSRRNFRACFHDAESCRAYRPSGLQLSSLQFFEVLNKRFGQSPSKYRHSIEYQHFLLKLTSSKGGKGAIGAERSSLFDVL
jgi:hypothetical protein